MPTNAAANTASTSDPTTGVSRSSLAVATPRPMPSGGQAYEYGHVDEHPRATGQRPAHPRQRGGEDHLQPARSFIGCPAGHERRRGQAGQQQPELDEEQLQEAAGRRVVDTREDRLEQLDELRRVA